MACMLTFKWQRRERNSVIGIVTVPLTPNRVAFLLVEIPPKSVDDQGKVVVEETATPGIEVVTAIKGVIAVAVDRIPRDDVGINRKVRTDRVVVDAMTGLQAGTGTADVRNGQVVGEEIALVAAAVKSKRSLVIDRPARRIGDVTTDLAGEAAKGKKSVDATAVAPALAGMIVGIEDESVTVGAVTKEKNDQSETVPPAKTAATHIKTDDS